MITRTFTCEYVCNVCRKSVRVLDFHARELDPLVPKPTGLPDGWVEICTAFSTQHGCSKEHARVILAPAVEAV